MIYNKTTLILGAGASKPYGFPVGSEIKTSICSLAPDYVLNNPGYVEHGHSYPLHRSFELGKLGKFQQDLRASRSFSIDAYLGHIYDSKPDYVEIGRAAIAATLIPLETPYALQDVDRDWYALLVNSMGRNYKELQKSAENLSVVTFNYDRSFEYYLYESLKAMCEYERAIHLLKTIQIVHIYGQLGMSDFLSQDGRPYSQKIDHYIVTACAGGIKIISDSAEDSDEFKKARSLIRKTKSLCFLGFGYDELNMKRLKVEQIFNGDGLFGTAYNLTENQRKRIESFFNGSIQLGSKKEDARMFLENYDVFGQFGH